MLLQNPFFSCLYSYLSELKKEIEEGCFIKILAECNTKTIGDNVIFEWDNFRTNLNFSNDIILRDISYEGFLRCIYNMRTGEMLVDHVPFVQYGNVRIPIFTGDLVQLIKDGLQKYISKEKIRWSFKDNFAVLAIDDEALMIEPSLKDVNNYILLQRVLNKIRDEKTKLEKDIESYKRQCQREEAAKERAIAKKRKIYGLDPNDFVSNEEFVKEFSKQICFIYDRKVTNISRHLVASKFAYRKLLESSFDSDSLGLIKEIIVSFENALKKIEAYLGYHLKSFSLGEYIYFLRNVIKKYDSDIGNYDCILEFIGLNANEEVSFDICTYEYMDECLLDFKNKLDQLNNSHNRDGVSLIYLYCNLDKIVYNDCDEHSEIMQLLLDAQEEVKSRSTYGKVGEELSIEEMDIWFQGNGFPLMILWVIDKQLCQSISDYHPIFCGEVVTWEDCDYHRTYKADFKLMKKAASILLQILALKTQLRYYKSILDYPIKAVDNFTKDSHLWGNILRFPYFIRMDADEFDHKEKFNLLLIKPKTVDVDLNNIKYFSADYGKRFGRNKTERAKIYGEVAVLNECDRLMVCIPSSISFDSMKSLVSFAYQYGEQLNFVCEDPSCASVLKSLLIEEEYKAFVASSGYYTPRIILVNVDPDYYNNFMVSTPSNKNFWHQYDYTSSYKFHRKLAVDFGYQIKLAIDILQKDGQVINVDKIKLFLLGSYCSHENKEYDFYQAKLSNANGYVVQNYILNNGDNDYDLEKLISRVLSKR